VHDALWKDLNAPGTLTLRSQLDLWQMLIPATQPLSKLDYEHDNHGKLVLVARFPVRVSVSHLLRAAPMPERAPTGRRQGGNGWRGSTARFDGFPVDCGCSMTE